MLRTPDPASPAPGADPVCSVHEIGTCTQLTAGGELDIAAEQVLRDAAARARLAPGHVVLLDLCAASFVDSSVVHFALELDRRATAHGSDFVVVVNERTKALFGLLGTEGLRVVEDERRNGAGPAAG